MTREKIRLTFFILNTRFNTLVHIKYYFKILSFNITKLKFFPQVRSKFIPFLFSVFLNDLEDYFKTLDGVPLEKLKERFYNELHILFELFVILYADDTVLMSETKVF
jgi:hypothetical protein